MREVFREILNGIGIRFVIGGILTQLFLIAAMLAFFSAVS